MIKRIMIAIVIASVSAPAVAAQAPLVANTKPLIANNALLVARDIAPIDPARLTTARALLNIVMPPAKREGMIDAIMKGMTANLQQSMQSSPQLKAAFEADPRVAEIMQRFFLKQQSASLTTLKANFPGMIEAMAHAYARRFTVAQMGEMRTFFQTPTGQVYISESPTIVNDPDVAKWQRDLMASTMGRIPAEAQAMMDEIKALPRKAGK